MTVALPVALVLLVLGAITALPIVAGLAVRRTAFRADSRRFSGILLRHGGCGSRQFSPSGGTRLAWVLEAAMRLRSHRRIVVRTSSGGWVDRSTPRSSRPARMRRLRWRLRVGALLTV